MVEIDTKRIMDEGQMSAYITEEDGGSAAERNLFASTSTGYRFAQVEIFGFPEKVWFRSLNGDDFTRIAGMDDRMMLVESMWDPEKERLLLDENAIDDYVRGWDARTYTELILACRRHCFPATMEQMVEETAEK